MRTVREDQLPVAEQRQANAAHASNKGMSVEELTMAAQQRQREMSESQLAAAAAASIGKVNAERKAAAAAAAKDEDPDARVCSQLFEHITEIAPDFKQPDASLGKERCAKVPQAVFRCIRSANDREQFKMCTTPATPENCARFARKLAIFYGSESMPPDKEANTRDNCTKVGVASAVAACVMAAENPEEKCLKPMRAGVL
jgi:hypothetical protein